MKQVLSKYFSITIMFFYYLKFNMLVFLNIFYGVIFIIRINNI